MAYDFNKISVLIIESTQPMFELTKSVLKAFGVNQIYHAFDAKQGFQKFCRAKPDLVIMDWLDEPANALQLTKKIRSDGESVDPYVPIILMSGHSSKKRVLSARDSGVTSFMAKPYSARVLYDRIEYLVECPRRFVRSASFCGPDRRSGRPSNYEGVERRTEDAALLATGT